jgi:multidrug transporter EmrE-like cation transporter
MEDICCGKYVIAYAIIISLFEIVAQSSMRSYRSNGRWRFMLLGIGMYALVALTLCSSYKYNTMGSVNLTWSCFSIMNAFLVGYFIFREPIHRNTMIAIAVAAIAIYFANKAS